MLYAPHSILYDLQTKLKKYKWSYFKMPSIVLGVKIQEKKKH